MKRKLCIIYNFAQKYREGIFRLIDEEYDCSWYFGTNSTDIKGLDTSILHNVTFVNNVHLFNKWYWQDNIIRLPANHDTFLVLGELYCLSTWILALICKFCPGKKIYFWSHGWYGKEGFIKRAVKRLFFLLANGTFLYGNYARKLMIDEGMNPSHLFVIHNSLNYLNQIQLRNAISDSEVYLKKFGNTDKTIIFIGRLTKVKRLDMLLSAVAKLKKRNENYNVVLVGDGEMRMELKTFSDINGLNVWFYGACYDEAKNAELIYNADLCVAPGNVGLTAMHAMAYGTPVLTHDNFKFQMPEFESVVDGETGLYFHYNDIDSLTCKIHEWFSKHSNDRDRIRNSCIREIDLRWTPEYQIETIKKHLEF